VTGPAGGSGVEEPGDFIEFMVAQGVLRFGEFTLKSGRLSPYFFNLGAIADGAATARLGDAYASRLLAAELDFDVVFGPAYKGIAIAVATAEALARRGRRAAWACNRKEAKGHGEGGRFVGADLAADLVLVDDVLTAGTALREVCGLLADTDARPRGVVIALDRQERLADGRTAVAALSEDLGMPVLSIATLADVIQYLDSRAPDANHDGLLARMQAYRDAHCLITDPS